MCVDEEAMSPNTFASSLKVLRKESAKKKANRWKENLFTVEKAIGGKCIKIDGVSDYVKCS